MMDHLLRKLQPVNRFLEKVQSKLNFEGWGEYSQFDSTYSLGRSALIGSVLGLLLGSHAVMMTLVAAHYSGFVTINFMDADRLAMVGQWCCYITAMAIFHLSEFFVTAVFNADVTSSQSFLINHSKAYTAAFLMASTEFSLRFLFCPNAFFPAACAGAIVVLVAQVVRSWAMITAGQSFNHMIQTAKKDNHVLITHGIYSVLRHPSYFGFFYWSVGTQLLLNNWRSMILFAAAAIMFFRRRIPYEEESLMAHFPGSYQKFAQSTWIGIPFVPNTEAGKAKSL
eukprot:Nitzschia sp. Nitz4//scaffold50_size126154//33668//34513//NITZ4_003675-RA/size126154-processed-gene-0.33-mRNA-1//1//CDS//3329553668//8610//frame0